MLGQQPTLDGSFWILLIALFGSAALAGQRIAQLLLGYRPRNLTEWTNNVLVTIVVAVLAADGVQLVGLHENLELNAWIRVGIVVVTVCLVLMNSRLAHQSQLPDARRSKSAVTALLIMTASTTIWSSYRFYEAIQPAPVDGSLIAEGKGDLIKSDRFVGVTDRGREIPLHRWKLAIDHDPKVIAAMMSLILGPLPSVIQREEPDPRSNCHGWVFTRGRFLLKGNDVEQILTDNRYVMVTKPQDGDVVIYRNRSGEILHTGLVVGILSDSSVMVESKWSVGCRFLHRVEDQPYSNLFHYYRTDRRNHSVAIRVLSQPDVAQQHRASGVPTAQVPVVVPAENTLVREAG